LAKFSSDLQQEKERDKGGVEGGGGWGGCLRRGARSSAVDIVIPWT